MKTLYFIYRSLTALPGLPTTRLAAFVVWACIACSFNAAAFTVIIDAGHGGNDAGALGAFTNEKSINLDVAQKVRDILRRELDCKIVMTRDDDYFVTLQSRADIANRAKGDIFISIHANSVGLNTPGRTSVNGASVYTLGLEKSQANMEVAKRENSVIMLEPDYTTTYQGFDPNSTESYIMFEIDQSVNLDNSIRLAGEIQRELKTTAGRRDNGVRQAPFYVLVKTAMPAVLVELDFICNPTQEKFMASEAGSTRLARAIANAVISYNRNCSPATVPANKPKTTKTKTKPDKKETVAQPRDEEQPTPVVADTDIPIYKVQFLTSGPTVLADGDSRFKGLTPVEHYIDTDGVVKYTTGTAATTAEAKKILSSVKKLFPQAFIIKTINGKRVR